MAVRSCPRSSAVCLMLFVAVYSFYFVQGGEGEFVLTDEFEPLDPANEISNDGKIQNIPITGTEDEFKTVQNTPKQQDGPIRITKVVHNLLHPQSKNGPIKTGKAYQFSKPRLRQNGTIVVEKEVPVHNLLNPQSKDGPIKTAKVVLHFSKPRLQNGPIVVGKGRPLHKGFLGGAKANSAFRIDKPLKSVKPARLLKPLSASKLLKAPAAKLTKKPSHSDVANTINLPKEDEFRNLECKDFLCEIKTGLAWDNDYLFPSNPNYQATRRATEVKVLNAYEDNKDFRGAFFNRFSSSEDPDGVKAYFTLRFRANGKFLGTLLDKFGPENVSAAGCYPDTPITQCPSSCPSTCAPACLNSCCQPPVSAPAAPQPVAPVAPQPVAPVAPQSVPPVAPVAPQPVYQPAPVPIPPPPPQPVPAAVPSPQVYQPPVQQWNPQFPAQGTRPPPRAQYPMSQPISWPGSQCSSSCSPSCAPICSPICCQFYDSKRNTDIKTSLKKEALQEEKH